MENHSVLIVGGGVTVLSLAAFLARQGRPSLLVERHPGDDGCGGADPGRGTGLRGLADRVEALGGTLEVDSPPARGRRCGRCCRAASSRRRLGAAPRGPGPGARGRRFRGAGAGR